MQQVIFLKKEHATQTANKLEADVDRYLQNIDQTSLPYSDLNTVKEGINASIDMFNKLHGRCKPIVPDWHDHRDFSTRLYLRWTVLVVYHSRELHKAPNLPWP